MSIEGVNIEYKELDRVTGKLPDSVAKEVCAFANTEGGDLYIGIADDGSTVGVTDPDAVMTGLSSVLHDAVLPDVIPFIQIRDEQRDGKTVIRVNVSVGTERPYYLKKKGLVPEGVYVRRGAASIPVHEAGIRNMIMDTAGKSFEESRSVKQDLTFDTFSAEMAKRGLESGPVQMKTLKMVGSDGLYTNLALLLSDQCPFSIKTAIFQGSDKVIFRDRKEFEGSVLKQLSEAYRFLDFYNKTKATFVDLDRIDRRDYPEDAVREALLNSIIHRDYLFSGSTIINLYDDRMEINSLGGLVSGLSMDAIMIGVSQSRNPNLASVFYRMKLVESYGTGIQKIRGLYADSYVEPVFRAVEGAFSVVLKNRNEEGLEPVRLSEAAAVVAYDKNLADVRKKVYEYAISHGSVNRTEVEQLTGYKRSKAYRLIRDMCETGILRLKTNGRLTVYLPK